MAVMLNPDKLTSKQIEEAEPLMRTIEKYDRQIAAEKIVGDVISEPFEKAKLRKDRIANIETKKRAVTKDLERILNAKNVFDEKVAEATKLIHEAGDLSDRYGFRLNAEQISIIESK